MPDSNLNQDHAGIGTNVGRDQIINNNFPPTDENRSELDVFNDYLATATRNQTATTSQPIIGKTVEHLETKNLRKLFAEKRTKEHLRKYQTPNNAPIDAKLRTLGLMTNGYVVKGTFLCLAHHSNFGLISNAFDECAFGAYNTLNKVGIKSSERPLGNVVQQYQQLIELVTRALEPMEMINIRNREWDYAIPLIAVQELLANAFVHRSYEPDARLPVDAEVYPDRLVITNAGSFPEEFDLKTGEFAVSKTQNKEIARIFFLLKYIESRGSGIARVQTLLAERGMRPLLFEQKNGFVQVTIYKNKNIDELKAAYNNALFSNNYPEALTIATQIKDLMEQRFGKDTIETAAA
ncbi:MAG: hypothetical protein RI894_387, partial [Bacteroidota bacterium]